MRNTVVIYLDADLNDSVDIHTSSSASIFSAQLLFFCLLYSIFFFYILSPKPKEQRCFFQFALFSILTTSGIYLSMYLMDTLVLLLMPPE